MEEERVAYCALNMLLGSRPRTGMALVGHFGSASAVFRNAGNELAVLIPELEASSWGKALEEAEKELGKTSEEGGVFICPDDSAYPPMLAECEDPPLGLYVKCNSDPAEIFGNPLCLALVGTRDMSSYGRDWCREFIDSLARTGQKPLIISGLAYGVDITAHQAALEAELPTVGVMATGIDTVYPGAHRHIASRMAGTEGCALVTDYPIGTAPVAHNFLRRNRIIAGLASKTILVESRVKGGGMTTARLAYSYEREVYALPGRVWDSRSEGCNLLIYKKIAEPVGLPDATVEAMGLGKPAKKRDMPGVISKVYADLEPQMRRDMESLARVLVKERGLGPEELAFKAGISTQQVRVLTGLLEADGLATVDLTGACSLEL